MCKPFKRSIYLKVLYLLSFISAAYSETESSYVKPKLERNNIVNKGLWIRNNRDRKYATDFIFRANSLDVDNVLQNNYDAFGQNNVANSAFFSGFNMERSKRSAKDKLRSYLTNKAKCDSKSNCQNIRVGVSKLISTLKPSSVFNDYPYEIAVLLDNKNDNLNKKHEKDNEDKKIGKKRSNKNNKPVNQSIISQSHINKENSSSVNYNLTYTIIPLENINQSHTNKTNIVPKRSMHPHDYETENELIKKLEFTEDLNSTNDRINNMDRSVFDKDDMSWYNAPTSNINVYKIIPEKEEYVKSKPINERGMLKVLTMLTKTFKKIMKQHQDIKRIHNKLYDLNDDFTKNAEELTSKFKDFNSKYLFMVNLNKELKKMEVNLKEKEQSFQNRHDDLTKNLKEFENHQKIFLEQQRQFYNVQKMTLAQNAKINMKQNTIAKTQNEISRRQNNFARILKKTLDSRTMSSTKVNTVITKPKKVEPIRIPITIPVSTQPSSTTTDRVNINLFSIPTFKSAFRLENQDQMILDEKDYQPVDELIYKYYFNNTFIDDLMKNKILATFIAASEAIDNNKNKRNEKINPKTTYLMPVNNTNKAYIKHRNRRWIKHTKKNVQMKDFRVPPITVKRVSDVQENVVKTDFSKIDITKKVDPFITMALNFCKEIGQNINLQMLNWCVEKALRRLKVIDLKISPKMTADQLTTRSTSTQVSNQAVTILPTVPIQKEAKQYSQNPTPTEEVNAFVYFPDNDELENKLKEYDLKPDTEGTVYYDGSLHASDIARIGEMDSDGFSDIMPGLDSNSRVQVDPMALDLQSQRRAEVRRINEKIMRRGMV